MKVSVLLLAGVVLSVSVSAQTPPLVPETWSGIFGELVEDRGRNISVSGAVYASKRLEAIRVDLSTEVGKISTYTDFRFHITDEIQYDFQACHQIDLPREEHYPPANWLQEANAKYVGSRFDNHTKEELTGWNVQRNHHRHGIINSTLWLTKGGIYVWDEYVVPGRQIKGVIFYLEIIKTVLDENVGFFFKRCPFSKH